MSTRTAPLLKKTVLISSLLLLCLFASSSIIAQTWPPSGMQGDGTNDSPWEITVPEHLATLAIYVNAGNGTNTIGRYYKLMNDIDLSEYINWKPIGVASTFGIPTSFHGNLNGNNKTVKNLIISRSTEDNIGLFGIIGEAGRIENLGVEDCDIVGGEHRVGGLVGQNYATINNCHVTGKIKGKKLHVGGLVGMNFGDTITNCYSTCNVSNAGCIGGLVGYNSGSAITNCYATGNINGVGECGGLIGRSSGGSISNCHATGTVNGNNCTGGLIGSNYGTLFQCFATGNVTGYGSGKRMGGLVGENWSADISDCYATGHVNGADYVGGLIGKCNLIGNTGNSTIFNSYATGDVNATGYLGNIGGLVGEGFGTSISECYAKGNVSGKGDDVGGLVGFNNGYCTISNCYATGDVSTTGRVGGLVGGNVSSSIFNCYATGNVSGVYEDVGGLVGRNHKSCVISYCYATGSVSGSDNVGGLVGNNYWGDINIDNCIAANASVVATTNTSHVDRIVGNANSGVCNNNYALNTMIVLRNGLPVTITDGSPKSGIGKSFDTFQYLTFYDLADNWYDNAWDIDTEANPNKIWKICDTLSLPFLQWQEKECENFIINATTGNNGIINPFGEVSVLESTDRTFVFFADEGFLVDSLLIDGVNKPEFIATGIYTFKDITQNHTIHVTFKLLPPVYFINVSANNTNWGAVSGSGSYEKESTATVIATPKTHCKFLHWTENGEIVSTDSLYTFTVEIDRNLVAVFEEVIGISDFALSAIKVYPNPTTGELRIENGELRIDNIVVYDVYGRKVFEQKETLTILRYYDITVLPAGVYFVRISTETCEVVRKILKE